MGTIRGLENNDDIVYRQVVGDLGARVAGCIVVMQFPMFDDGWPHRVDFSSVFLTLLGKKHHLYLIHRYKFVQFGISRKRCTLSSVLDIDGHQVQGSDSTLSWPSLKSLCHLKAAFYDMFSSLITW